MTSSPTKELTKIKGAVRKEFRTHKPSKKEVVTYLKTTYLPKMDGGASAALLLLLLKYGPLVSIAISSWASLALTRNLKMSRKKL